ncbi:ABC transporter permease [Pseudodesulfovibrio sediminis]|uniref:Transport permease protein n=1 Tax=Pseudodesulfovibrio sediminis TaxID=2810563 RepID=A0ABM7P4Z2_9BACT|nr:ABC transporter permease [Pseudodesulfovibrio sediminis]BCS87977.1 transport permease protein [Pseudodesulfovibrio sediminis]
MTISVFMDLLLFRTFAGLRNEVSHYYLNYLWWVFSPLSTMLVFYLVFGVFLNQGTENYVGFLICGISSWQWFANTVNNSASSINNGRGLMLQVNIPKIFFPVEVLLMDSFKHAFVVCLLLIFLLIYPTPVSITWIALPLLLVIQFITNAAFALLVAMVVPFVPDLRFVVQTVIQLAFFGSGVFYSIDEVVLPKHRAIIYANPMAGLIKNYRDILLDAQWPDWNYLLWVFLGSSCLLACCILLITRLNHVYPRICQQ